MGSSFFTIAYGTVDKSTGEYRVARAGYSPVLHLAAGGGMRVHYTKGAAVGVILDADIEEATGVLRRGIGSSSPRTGYSRFSARASSRFPWRAPAHSRTGFGGGALENFVDAFRRRSAGDEGRELQ